MRQYEDHESVTTSIDSYPFSPSSPWAHALPSRYVPIVYGQFYCLVCFRYNRFGYPVFPQRSFGLASPSGIFTSFHVLTNHMYQWYFRSSFVCWVLLPALPTDILKPWSRVTSSSHAAAKKGKTKKKK